MMANEVRDQAKQQHLSESRELPRNLMISRSTTQLEVQPVNANDMWFSDTPGRSTSIIVFFYSHRSEAKERTSDRKKDMAWLRRKTQLNCVHYHRHPKKQRNHAWSVGFLKVCLSIVMFTHIDDDANAKKKSEESESHLLVRQEHRVPLMKRYRWLNQTPELIKREWEHT